MTPADKFGRSMGATAAAMACLALTCALAFPACDRMVTPRNAQLAKDGDTELSQGDFLHAINLYESALDGTPHSAEIHYKLALLYDDKMNDPLNAMHHFKRYLTLAPNGARAAEVKSFMKRDEIALLTSLSGDSVVTRTESARLRNENLNLRKQIEERAGKLHAVEEKSEKHNPPAEKTPAKKNGRPNLCREIGRHLIFNFAKILQIALALEGNPRCEQECYRQPRETATRPDADHPVSRPG